VTREILSLVSTPIFEANMRAGSLRRQCRLAKGSIVSRYGIPMREQFVGAIGRRTSLGVGGGAYSAALSP
jgi:hypothetical protein